MRFLKSNKSLFDYSITVVTKGFSRLFALLITVIIARSLSTDDFGLYSLFFGIFILIFQAQAGINIAHVRYARLNIVDKNCLLRLSQVSQTFLTTLLILIGWPVSILISSVIGIDDIRVAYFGFVSSGLLGLYGVWFGVYQSEGKFTLLGIYSLAFNLILMLYISAAYLSGIALDLKHVLYSYLILSALFGITSFYYLTIYSSYLDNKELSREYYRMIFLNIIVTLLYFLYRYIDVYFLKYFSDLETVAIYSVAMKTSMILSILTGSLPTILLPKAVDAINSKRKIGSYIMKSSVLCIVIAFGFFVFYLLSPYILEILFGQDYVRATSVMQLLIIGWLINSFYIPVAQIFYALNKVGWRITIEVIKLFFTIVFFVLLIPAYGADGAAYALIFSIGISLILASFICLILLKQHFSAYPKPV